LSGGDHRWFKRSTRKKRPVTRDDVNNNNNNNNNNNIIIIIIINAHCLNYHTGAEGDLSLPGCDAVYIASGHMHYIRRV
jgi:hypothetical protein